jgi:hypothetical protein
MKIKYGVEELLAKNAMAILSNLPVAVHVYSSN